MANWIPRQFSKRLVYVALFILVILNLVGLDIWVAQNRKTSTETNESLNIQAPIIQAVPTDTACPASCVSQIQEATASVNLALPKTTIVTTPSPTTSLTSSSVREFYVPLGSGSNATDDWADVPGVQAYIDSAQYGSIKNVVFEASVSIPTGNQKAYVRLFNVTDKHPVWFSDVFLEGGTGQLLISNYITLDSGNKLYKVQMKTSLKYTANLTQARVHITTY